MIIATLLRSLDYRPKVIVHVGAHLAEEAEAYRALRPERIIWVEADPDLAERLRAIVGQDPQQNVVEALIADTDGTQHQFHRFNNDGASSSVFAPTDLLAEHWPGVTTTGDVISLGSSRLDSVLSGLGLAPGDVDVIVFDIQGAELLAMKGAGEYLARASFVEAEVSKEPIYVGAPLADEVDDFLQMKGFERLTGLPWHGDAVFRRRDAISTVDLPMEMRGNRQAEAMFHSKHYLIHSRARLDHLSTIKLPLRPEDTVLEPGAGIGDHTAYYLARGCRVTAIEPRPENCASFRANMHLGGWPDGWTLVEGDVGAELNLPRHNVVHSYGILYHLADPAQAIGIWADRCIDYMVLETCVSFGDAADVNEIDEPSNDLSQSVEGKGCRPTRRWIWEKLTSVFPYVYSTATQPQHPEFPTDWRRPEAHHAAFARAIFVASHAPIDNPNLLSALPERQRQA